MYQTKAIHNEQHRLHSHTTVGIVLAHIYGNRDGTATKDKHQPDEQDVDMGQWLLCGQHCGTMTGLIHERSRGYRGLCHLMRLRAHADVKGTVTCE